MKNNNAKLSATSVPEIAGTIDLVSEYEGEGVLNCIKVDTGIFKFSLYQLADIDLNQEKDGFNEILRKISGEDIFLGEPDHVCTELMQQADIWDEASRLKESQVDFLSGILGEDVVREKIREFGDDFRFLGAKKVIELRSLSFSPVWYALGVLICHQYYKNHFQAGALWALLQQKVLQEPSLFEALKSSQTTSNAQKLGTRTTQKKAEQKKSVVIRVAVELAKNEGHRFWMLPDKEKASQIRKIAVQLEPQLFFWDGKLHQNEYFLKVFENNKTEISSLLARAKA